MTQERDLPTAQEFLPGYAELSEYMSSDFDLSIYRRFGPLCSRNILYLQAEIQVLQKQLQDLDDQDHDDTTSTDLSKKMNALQAAKDWETLVRRAKAKDPRQEAKLSIIRSLRPLLKEYQEALLLISRMAALDKPSHRAFKTFSKWWSQKLPLYGYGVDLLDNPDDLVAIRTPPEQDRLDKFVNSAFGYMLKKQRQTENHPPSWHDTYYFPQKTSRKIAVSFAVAYMIVMIIIPIYVATDFKSVKAFWTLVCSISSFCIAIGFFTNASRSEIFAATAAYAALIVVFVASTITDDTSYSILATVGDSEAFGSIIPMP